MLLNYFRSTDVLEASVHRKRKFDPSLQGRQADFSIYVPIKDKRIYLLTSEVKSADYMVSNKNKITLEDCDLVKLGNEMKDIIDKCIDDGIKNNDLITCGLLVKGKLFTLIFKIVSMSTI